MTRAELLKLFPNANSEFLSQNASDFKPRVSPKKPIKTIPSRVYEHPGALSLTFSGQIRGGKNAIIVTRSGGRFPKKEWAKWRDERVAEVKAQLPVGWMPLCCLVKVSLDYWAGDMRRRDFPAICDAIWHVLEKAEVVKDDTLLWPVKSSRSYDKENPRAVLELSW